MTVVREGAQDTTLDDGSFTLQGIAAAPLIVTRPAWETLTVDWPAATDTVVIELRPFTVRALRVSAAVAGDVESFAALLGMAESTAANAFVFDTKAEGGTVLYATGVAEANEIDAVVAAYDPAELLAAADTADLYTITRIVTFEDPVRSAARPEARLAGTWVDPADEANWEYPLELAVEACALGFDEIQFDYVRYPDGQAARDAAARTPQTSPERVEVIRSFLAEARSRLHPLGCALSADVFAIVMSAEDDQGIGQRPEELSGVIDAISPMVYPSHYSNGWLGYPDPNEHPGPVVADALDDGGPRLAVGALLRPWLQAFGYTPDQILTQIAEAEERGHGWMLWNARGRYEADALPPQPVE